MRSRLALGVVMISAMAAAAVVAASSARIGASPAPAPQVDVPTWSKDIAPIVQKNCQVCHRPGEAGPFSLLTYQDARRRAAKIKDAVVDRVMPPWFADPHHGKFSNAMGLSASEIDTIVKWVDGGSPEGDPRDLPKPAEWVEGWGIGKPDMVFELPQPFDVPTSGVVEYQHVIVPTNFTEDPLDSGGGNTSDRAIGRASPHRVRPRAEIEVVPRSAGRRLLHGAEGQHG
jgi:cytochrome c5